MTANRSWLESYTAAMLELDLDCLPGRIESAQAAIRQAMKELAAVPPEWAAEEMQEMSSALGNLQALQRVALRGSKPAEPGPSSDRGAIYGTIVPQDSSTDLAQTAVSDNGTASSRESRDRFKPAGMPARPSCEA